MAHGNPPPLADLNLASTPGLIHLEQRDWHQLSTPTDPDEL